MPATKHIPLRHCVACRAEKPKAELLRVVNPPEGGDIVIDTVGKVNGRGAYICKAAACVQKAQKSRALERHLKRQIDAGVYDTLRAACENHG